jgi:hypothetical protein
MMHTLARLGKKKKKKTLSAVREALHKKTDTINTWFLYVKCGLRLCIIPLALTKVD